MSNLNIKLKVKVLPCGFVRKAHSAFYEAFENLDSLMSYLAHRIDYELRLQEFDPTSGLRNSRDVRELSIHVSGVDHNERR